jgi:heme A synthase
MAIAIPLVVLIGTQSDLPMPNIPLHDLAASGIIFALVVLLAWRFYEYRRDRKALARLLERKAEFERQSNQDT